MKREEFEALCAEYLHGAAEPVTKMLDRRVCVITVFAFQSDDETITTALFTPAALDAETKVDVLTLALQAALKHLNSEAPPEDSVDFTTLSSSNAPPVH